MTCSSRAKRTQVGYRKRVANHIRAECIEQGSSLVCSWFEKDLALACACNSDV